MRSRCRCALCNGDRRSLVTDTVRFGKKADVYRCEECGLIFLDQVSFKFPENFYESEYHQTYITHIEPDAFNPQAYYEKMKKSTFIWAEKFSAMLTGTETVLDIGCSTGHFIDMIKGKSGKVYGSDLNVKEIKFCRDVLGLDVSDAPLKDRFGPGTFDYITMIYVLEHIARPKEFLLSVRELLKPHGKMVILVPNAQDALVRLYSIPEFKGFYYCIEHLFYYTQGTIKHLFESIGLEGGIEVVQEYPLANHLNWAYRREPSDTLASRKGLPDVALQDDAPVDAWSDLWDGFNRQYHDFLRTNGYGDRLWCVMGKG